MRSSPKIAWLGTGLMGEPMAQRLLSANCSVTVWNRTPEKTRALVRRGARVFDTPAEAATAADLVILMLADGPAVTEVLFEGNLLSSVAAGAVVMDMSSIPPTLARGHAARLHGHGVHHLDAPVSGGTKGASEGTLAIMVGGEPQVYEKSRPVLEHLGRSIWVGPSGSGQLAKLANQIIVAVSIGAVAEALLFAAAGGADPVKVKEALSGGFADSAILRQHGQRMLDRAWVPGGLTRTQVKDLRTIQASASELGLQLPLAHLASELFESGMSAGFGGYDHSALLLELERRNRVYRVGSNPDQCPGESKTLESGE